MVESSTCIAVVVRPLGPNERTILWALNVASAPEGTRTMSWLSLLIPLPAPACPSRAPPDPTGGPERPGRRGAHRFTHGDVGHGVPPLCGGS